MFSLTRLQAYGIAVVGVILAAAVRKAINPMLGEDLPLFVFILPIVVAGWFGGLWPGMLSTLLSCVIGHRFFIHHVNQLNLTREFALAFTGTGFSMLFEKTLLTAPTSFALMAS